MSNKGPTAIIVITLVGVLFGAGIIFGIAVLISMFSSGGFPTTMEDYQPMTPGIVTWILGFFNIIWAAVYGTVMTNLFTLLYLRLRPQSANQPSGLGSPPVSS